MKCNNRLSLLLLLLIGGCSMDSNNGDLEAFIADVKNKPGGKIDPIPTSESYEIFAYSASALRSPFEPPRQVLDSETFDQSVKPDPFREREYLERFDIASFSMVGHISNEQGRWGLIRGQEIIYKVMVGDYLGRNHGRITSINDEDIQLVELMPVGPSLWVERQRRIPLTSGEASQ